MAKLNHKRQANCKTRGIGGIYETPRDGIFKVKYDAWESESCIKSKAWYKAQDDIREKLEAKRLSEFE